MINQEIPRTFISKDEAEKEAEEMKRIIQDRRKITEPVRANTQDHQEAYEKVERDRNRGEMENSEGLELKEIQELFDAVLFDWDGVLYDSMENLAKGAVEVCREFGVEVDVKKFLETYDQPYQVWYGKLGIPADNEDAHQYIRCLYHNEILPMLGKQKKDTMFSDAVGTLRDLKVRGLKLGIVSAGREEDIQKVLKENDIEDIFDYASFRADNKTEAIRRICEDSDLDPERVLMVGDLPSDLRDARKAGVKLAGVARFEEGRDRLGSYDPDYMLGGLGEEIMTLKPYIDNDNKL